MATSLHIQYDFIPSEILDPATSAQRIALMKAAGVETIWLDVYAYGNRLATKQEILDARALLERHGFEVQVVTVPVGHGGAALSGDAGDPGVPAHCARWGSHAVYLLRARRRYDPREPRGGRGAVRHGLYQAVF